MAFCRFGIDSDLYLYADVLGGITCKACKFGHSINLKNWAEVWQHIGEHKRAGHKIHPRLENSLMKVEKTEGNLIFNCLSDEELWGETERE